MVVSSLPKTVTRQRRDCDLNPGPSAPESSTLTTRLPSQRIKWMKKGIRVLSRGGGGCWCCCAVVARRARTLATLARH